MTNALMDQATEKFTKCLHTNRVDGEVPQVLNTRTEPEQALFICQYIHEQMQQGRPLSDIAVLFRAGYHSFELEAELTRQSIAYVKYGGFKFLESAHIKDFLAHLRVTLNRDEAVSWIRILRLVDGVGHARSQGIIDWMRQNDVPPGGMHQWPGCRSKDQGLQSLGKLLAGLTSKKLDPKEAVEKVMAYYLPILKGKFDDYPRRSTELEQLLPMAGRYKSLRNFLDDLVLEPPSSPADMEAGRRSDALTLSTVHSAKGLEWPVVVIMWVMEGRFPSARAYQNPAELEEERRLMYVAATRAKDCLILCYPGEESVPIWFSEEMDRSRYRQGLSFFIQALPDGVVQYQSTGVSQQVFPSPARLSAKQPLVQEHKEPQGFSTGDRVRHPAFGPGVVSKFMGDDKVEVLFRDVGRKLLHLEYTTLEKI
jgi:DNA helicase-2/ATP-dependent DNA helicase PcrA